MMDEQSFRRAPDSLAPRASQRQGRTPFDDDVHAARVDKNSRTYTGHRAPLIIFVLEFLDERALPFSWLPVAIAAHHYNDPQA